MEYMYTRGQIQLVKRNVCVHLLCISVAISITLAVTRAGCRIVLSMLEGKCSVIQREIDYFEVLLFSLSDITIIFVLFCSWGLMYRQTISISNFYFPHSLLFYTHRSCSKPPTSMFAQLRLLLYRTTAQYQHILIVCVKYLFILQCLLLCNRKLKFNI